MNYLVATDKFFLDKFSGSARVAWDIAKVMKDQGHTVAMLCWSESPDGLEVSEHEGIKIVRYKPPKTWALNVNKFRRHQKAGVEAAKKYLSNVKWDVIHIHNPYPGSVVYRAFKPKKFIYTAHSPIIDEMNIVWEGQGLTGFIKKLFGSMVVKKLEKGILRKADKIHTLSKYTKLELLRRYKLPDNISVIPHWCRQDFHRILTKKQARERLGWPEDAKIFFSVRRLANRMGLDVAIKAIAESLKKEQHLYFALAGVGEQEEYLKHLAKVYEVEDKIWFLGRVDDEKLKHCYEAADLFLLPTRALECFGLIILEAYAYGLPVIATDAGAIPEIVEPIMPQCIVKAGSITSLKNKIEDYIYDGQLDLTEPEVFMNYVFENYSIDKITAKLVEFLS